MVQRVPVAVRRRAQRLLQQDSYQPLATHLYRRYVIGIPGDIISHTEQKKSNPNETRCCSTLGGATKAHQAMDGNKGREGGPSPVEPGGDVGMHLANPPPLADERRKGQKQHLSAEGQPLPLKNGGRCGVLRFPRGMACKGLLGFWGGGGVFLSFLLCFFFSKYHSLLIFPSLLAAPCFLTSAPHEESFELQSQDNYANI